MRRLIAIATILTALLIADFVMRWWELNPARCAAGGSVEYGTSYVMQAAYDGTGPVLHFEEPTLVCSNVGYVDIVR